MKIRNSFTLVELLVAMGIFCLLLMVSMQIFGGAQKLWVSSEQKNSAFAAARTAMEFVAARIQTCVYTEDMPFEIYKKNDTSKSSCIYFATSMPMNRKKNGVNFDEYDIRFVGFEYNEDNGVLEMRIFSDRINADSGKYIDFPQLLPPFRERKRKSAEIKSYEKAHGKVIEYIGNAGDRSGDLIEIIDNVVGFKLIPFNVADNKSSAKIEKKDECRVGNTGKRFNTPPYLLEIEISVIDSKANYDKWKKAGAGSTEREEIEQESGYTFRRAVLLGDRRNKI